MQANYRILLIADTHWSENLTLKDEALYPAHYARFKFWEDKTLGSYKEDFKNYILEFDKQSYKTKIQFTNTKKFILNFSDFLKKDNKENFEMMSKKIYNSVSKLIADGKTLDSMVDDADLVANKVSSDL